MRKFRAFQGWDDHVTPQLPRTILHPLEPVGIGGAFVESLTSYVVRLADAHALCVGDLVGRILSRDAQGRQVRLYRASQGINGFGHVAEQWVDALSSATKLPNLKMLT